MFLAAAALASLAVPSIPSASATSARSGFERASEYVAVPDPVGFVLREADGTVSCAEVPVRDEALLQVDPGVETRPIPVPNRDKTRAGMTIQLRGTAQLDRFPQAKAAFVRAAAVWEELVSSPITVILSVDYGPTRFGQSYPTGVLGSTSTQSVYRPGNYPEIRSALLAQAVDGERAAVYGALPPDQLQTDIGPTANVIGTSATLRAIGELPPVPNPLAEFPLGPLPAVGFNSEFDFDFNPADGIDGGSYDFDAIAVHEIGHALGFVSSVGEKEMNPNAAVAVSLWDLFRFRPGTTLQTFGSASRILSSGGEQMFFAGGRELALSTGRPDHTGGDENQASHWKADDITGRYIGIMDPTIARGDREEMTENDRKALQFFGYGMRGVGDAPTIESATADLDGDALTLAGSGSDPDGNVTKAQVVFYDATGLPLGRSEEVDLDVGSALSFEFTVQVSGLADLPTAVRAGLFLIDADGNQSVLAKARFDEGESGGPAISKAAFKASKGVLKITGSRFTGQLQLEINGVLYGSTVTPNRTGTKIKVNASASALGLRAGQNRVRVIADGLHSNISIVKA
jgi:hypothetical protein